MVCITGHHCCASPADHVLKSTTASMHCSTNKAQAHDHVMPSLSIARDNQAGLAASSIISLYLFITGLAQQHLDTNNTRHSRQQHSRGATTIHDKDT
jgi:hypothetical protein